jgi:hypothetical protein
VYVYLLTCTDEDVLVFLFFFVAGNDLKHYSEGTYSNLCFSGYLATHSLAFSEVLEVMLGFDDDSRRLGLI